MESGCLCFYDVVCVVVYILRRFYSQKNVTRISISETQTHRNASLASRVPGHQLPDNGLEAVAEVRVHFVTEREEEEIQLTEGHGWSVVSGIATGELYHEDVACEVLAPAIFEIAEKTCGMPIGRGVGSGMLDEINHREHEMSRRHRAAHVDVGHALLELVDHLLRHDGHDGGHVCRVQFASI
jgi:hypothetical protein